MTGIWGLGQAGRMLPGEAEKEGESCIGESGRGGSSSRYRTLSQHQLSNPLVHLMSYCLPGGTDRAGHGIEKLA